MTTLVRPLHRCAIAFGLVLAIVAAIAGCGGDGSTTVVTNSGTGTVVVVVVDGPSDDFVSIWLTVTKIELLGAQGHFTLFEGHRELDLLAMRDDARLLSLGHEVPAGDWSKIRLHVEDVEMIRVVRESDARTILECPVDVTPDPGFVCESIRPKIVANGKIDLNPRGPIEVRGGELVFVQLDLDANKSIHLVQTGNDRYIFRPVVFVDLFAARPDRLVRIEGAIEEVDVAAGKLVVCDTHLVFRANAQQEQASRSRCVDVRFGPDTAVFGSDGQPAAQGDLAVGDEIAAIGRFRVGTGEALVFDALWIQQGGFDAGVAVTGVVQSGVSGDEFTISPDPDGPISEDLLTVRLLPGAKLFDRAGDPVAPGDLDPGLRVRVFGALAGEAHLDASLVFVRERADLAELHGKVTRAFDPSDDTIVIQSVTGTTVGPACIALEPGDGVFRITENGELLLSERIEPSALAVGEEVDVFGHPADPCFDAETLLSFGAEGS